MEKIYDFITAITLANGIVFGVLFLFNLKKNDPLKFLGIFLLMSVGVNLQWFANNPRLLVLSFSYMIVTMFYIYIRKVLGIFTKKDYFHLLPGILEILFVSGILFYYQGSDHVFFSKENETAKLVLFFILPPLYNIVYAILSIILVKKYQKLVTIVFTDVERQRLHWLVVTCCILMFSYILELLSVGGLLFTNWDMYLFLYQAFAGCFVVYWVAIYGLNQKSLQLQSVLELHESDTVINDSQVILADNKKPLFQKEALSEEKYTMIVTFFNETKIYKNKEINLFMVADLLPLTYRDVSRLINTFGNKNFCQFVNEFRIRESQELLLSDYFDKYNLASVGEEVGFNSRATFFAAFKSITGTTPLEFRKRHKEKSDS